MKKNYYIEFKELCITDETKIEFKFKRLWSDEIVSTTVDYSNNPRKNNGLHF